MLVHNACHNPYGKAGGPEHQKAISDAKSAFERAGYNVTTEHKVDTTGGYKKTRYLDLYVTNGSVEFGVQVGVATQSGMPVAREMRAIMDIVSTGMEVYFVPYKTR